MTPAGRFTTDARPGRPARRTSRSRPAPGSRRCCPSWPRSSRASPGSSVTLVYANRTHRIGDVPRRGARPQGPVPRAAADRPRALPREPGRRAVLGPARRAAGCAGSSTRCCPPDEVDDWFLCGPQQMVEELRAVIVDAGGGAGPDPQPSCSTPTRSRGRRSPRWPGERRAPRSVTILLDGRGSDLDAATGRRTRPGGGPAGPLGPAVRLQGRGVRHLPGQGRRGQRRDGRQLRARAGRGRRGLRAHLPVAPHRRRVVLDYDA